jgi:hypothetical protein
MNKTSAQRVISKQEAVVLLGNLDMFTCSETIESVSISNSKVLRTSEERSVDKTFIRAYESRDKVYEQCSLYQFFHLKKAKSQTTKQVIPHFVGVSGTPKFPVTETYARHVLTVYRPWRVYPKDCAWISEFETFINSNTCPASAKMHYERAMCRYYDNMTHYEPKASNIDHSVNPISSTDEELMTLVGLKTSSECDEDTRLLKQLDRGLEFQWDKEAKVSATTVGVEQHHTGYHPNEDSANYTIYYRTHF